MKTQNLKIFIVEDDNFFATMLKDILSKNHYSNVKIFNTGESCIDSIDYSPDVIILDHNLGNRNGLDILQIIKSRYPSIHVIFLSAQEKLTVAINALKHGAYDYLEKNSDDIHRLLNILKRISKINEMTDEIKQFKKFRFLFYGCVVISIALIFYLSRLFHW